MGLPARLAHPPPAPLAHGEDPRYAEMLGGPVREVGFGVAVRKVFVVQGAGDVVRLAAGAGRRPRRPALWWPVLVVGVRRCGWSGVVFEAVGDAQLAAYKRTPTGAR